MNIAVWLSYEGTRYDGWQKQGNTDRTIQGKLEAVLEKSEGCPVEVHGSGRTDAGVHAEGQVANFHLKRKADTGQLLAYMNRYLPDDIAVREARIMPERFHSRLNAVKKTYRYQIEMGPKKDVFKRHFYYGLGRKLDVGEMERAAACLMGTHDFKSFCGNKKMKKSTVRTIESIRFERVGDSCLHIAYTGDGFLQQMVRILTGTLVEVGLGRQKAENLPSILAAKDRQASGFTAPPEGLVLESVDYGEML